MDLKGKVAIITGAGGETRRYRRVRRLPGFRRGSLYYRSDPERFRRPHNVLKSFLVPGFGFKNKFFSDELRKGDRPVAPTES